MLREDLVQRGLRRQRVAGRGVGVGAPEAAPTAAHVPVREIVDQVGQRGGGIEGLVPIEPRGDDDPRAGQPREDPAIEGTAFPAAGIAGSAGSKPLSEAYVVKKLKVFHSFSNMSRNAVSMADRLARVGVHGRALAEHPPTRVRRRPWCRGSSRDR